MKRSILVFLGLVCLCLIQIPLFGFTQGIEYLGSIMPVGHEWITRQAAIEVLGGADVVPHDPNDPRRGWPAQARAQNPSVAGAETEVARIKRDKYPNDPRAAATYKAVADAIIGERWVDIAGVDVSEARTVDRIDCFDSAAQEPQEIQYDHFMRTADDPDAAGGAHAATQSGERFVKYFVAAAMAPDGELQVWDGGAFSALETVDRHYFLFGRALHVFQDSFSEDHTVRDWAKDNNRTVQQVKSYLCAPGSEQHAHILPTDHAAFFQTGDVIWLTATGGPGWSSYIPSNIKTTGLSAIEGSKDMWAAFIRTMAKPRGERAAHAQKEALALQANWLAFDNEDVLTWYREASHRGPTYVKSNNPDDDGGHGTTQQECMNRDWKGVTVEYQLQQFKNDRRTCLYNMIPNWGAQTDFDESLHLAYYWNWRANTLETPPDGWNIDKNDDVNVLDVKIANRVNGEYMRREGNYVYNDKPDTPKKQEDILRFAIPWHNKQPLNQTVTLPVIGLSDRFLNRAGGVYGLVGLYTTPDKGHYSFERRTDGYYNIRNVDDQLYVYMDPNEKDYINKRGLAENKNAQWRVEGLPEPYPADGIYFVATGGHALAIENNQLVVGRGGRVSELTLQRQTDGSYKLSLEGQTLALDPATHRLVTNATATLFEVQKEQRGGTYIFRSSDGTYWGGVPQTGNPILSNASAACLGEACTLPLAFTMTRKWN